MKRVQKQLMTPALVALTLLSPWPLPAQADRDRNEDQRAIADLIERTEAGTCRIARLISNSNS